MQLRSSTAAAAAALILVAGITLASGVDTVYVSNPDMDRIYAIDTAAGAGQTPAVVLYEAGSSYEDLVIAPDGSLVACDPSRGKIVRVDLATSAATQIHLASSAGAPFNPQCGWFTHTGDLVVTDKAAGGAAWLFLANPDNFYHECQGASPCRIEVDAAFRGEGATQAADGDLLTVDRAQRTIWSFNYDFYLGAFSGSDDLIFGSAVNDPIGIARSSRGNIYLTVAPNRLVKYDRLGAASTIPACATGFGSKDRPYFLDFAADDTLYVATTSNNSGKVWELDVEGCDCNGNPSDLPQCSAPRVLFEFRKQAGYEKSTVGIGVPYLPGAGDGLGAFLSGKPIPPPPTTPNTQLVSFADHVYEFTAEPAGCTVDITAAEADPMYLESLAGSIDLAPFDPDYPSCTVVGDPSYPCDIAARPVTYLGENGRGVLYEVLPQPAGNPLCYAPQVELFRHAINAYAGYVPNPRLVRCPSPGDSYDCMLIDLNTYFPYNGILPEDTRIGSTLGASSGDFSRYFIVDLDLNQDADAGDGVYCGFESPWYEPMLPTGVSWNDADVLDQTDPSTLLPISTTQSFGFKFKIAEITGFNPDATPVYNCDAGPFIEDATVLMSVARVRDPFNVPLDPFEPKRVYAAGSSAVVDPALFNAADNPNKQYHFNAKFPAFEYAPGIYQIVLVPLSNNFAAEVRYFRIVP
jgi:sugar lactone lactonase YvrE